MHYTQAKSLLSPHNGMNLYRGCTHGCIYCDARSRCYGMTHAFEDVEVKQNAPELLERALRSKRAKCMIGTGAMSDPYQPLELSLGLTRECLRLIARYGFGLAIQTKSCNVLRDIDLLERIHRQAKCVVQMTLTTCDESVCRIVEPNVSTTRERVEALRALHARGIPTVVWLSPFLPGINDTEENVRGLASYCADAGVGSVICFGIGLTLRDGDREYYYAQFDRHFPGLKATYVRRYGNAYEIPSPDSDRLMRILSGECARRGVRMGNDLVFEYLRTLPPRAEQCSLFDSPEA